MRTVKIGNRNIAKTAPPLIVAEMSGNHNQSLQRALDIVEAAAKAGAHALKLQTYTPDTMTIDCSEGDFFISTEENLWKGNSLYDLYAKAHTPWEWHEAIFEKAKGLGLMVFSTPFDETAVDFLEALDVPCYKIASFENTDLNLIKKVCSTGKPILLSTGLATLSELSETVSFIKENGNSELILLKCTSSYPASPENSNLATIPHMRELFGCEVGLSDHTLGIGVAVASVAFGATIIEKHFTLDRSDGGVDALFSLEPDELSLLVSEAEKAWQGIGEVRYGITSAEVKSKIFKRSVYVVENLRAGDVLTRENIRVIRPGKGLAPKYYDVLLGKTVRRDVKKGVPANWDLLVEG